MLLVQYSPVDLSNGLLRKKSRIDKKKESAQDFITKQSKPEVSLKKPTTFC